MPWFSQPFLETLRDISEKCILACVLTVAAVLLHFLMVGCEAAHLPAWILLLLSWVFGIVVLCDGLTMINLSVVLLIRVAVGTVRELTEFFKK